MGTFSLAAGLKYGKINSIPTSLSSNSTQQVEQVQNYVEEDIDTDGKIIKTGSVILIGNQEVYQRLVEEREFNLLEENDQQVVLAKADGNPVTPPTNRGPSNLPTSPAGGRRPSRPITGTNPYRHLNVNPGIAGNPGGPGNGGNGGASGYDYESEIPQIPQEIQTCNYDYSSNSKKKQSQDQCSIDEQKKAGIDELPDSPEFIYKLETKTARKALKKVWKNDEAKTEVLAGLNRINNGELLPRNQKNFKGFKTLKEVKFTKTRMLVQPGINGGPDQIVAICMQRDLNNVALNLKGKYKYMKIKRIEFAHEITDPYMDNLDVFVENENGYTYTIVVSTPGDLLDQMEQEKINFIMPGTPKIIVKKLTEQIVREAIQAYAENDGYWLKLCQFGDDIDISVLNKLEAEHRKEWEGWEED